ncbi:hypothetical protein LXA43DRAFT_1096510 [Ganoderma leucocontextum]|nr:hypothetical protein LXA43DRAFT_1096510 [Ganoderma leucocontextum]
MKVNSVRAKSWTTLDTQSVTVQYHNYPPMQKFSSAYTREYFNRFENATVGSLQLFADNIDETFLKTRASLLAVEDVSRDHVRNAIIIVYEVIYANQGREAIARVAQRRRKPSEEAKPAMLLLAQDPMLPRLDVVYGGRSPYFAAPFVGIYHPVFARFIRTVATPPDQLNLTSQELEWAYSLVAQSSSLLHTQADAHMPHIIAMDSGIALAGTVHMQLGHDLLGTFPLLVEIENEIGEGDSDPADHAACDYVAVHTASENKKLRDISCCPALLVGIIGPRLIVCGAVYTDTLVVQELTCYNTLGNCATVNHRGSTDDAVYRAARLLRALKAGVRELLEYYQELWSVYGHCGERCALCHCPPTPEHPHFRKFSIGATTVKLEYVERLAGANPRRAVFKARVVDFDPPPSSPAELASLPPTNGYVAVKFTPWYSGDAHALLAQQSPPAVTWIGALRTAVEVLHEHGFVFGNLYGDNVFVPCEKLDEVRLVDFDLAGRAGQVRYPSNFYMERADMWPWHPG